jgi:beta-lactamase regulating signal transducer with metallopeptidase domain
MDTADLIGLLTETTLAASAALLLVLGLRRPLRRGFGPGVGYGVWLLVPAAIVAVLLPAAVAPAVPIAFASLEVSPVAVAAAPIGAGVRHMTSLGALWLLGALIATGLFAQQQRCACGKRGLGQQADQVSGVHRRSPPAACAVRRCPCR